MMCVATPDGQRMCHSLPDHHQPYLSYDMGWSLSPPRNPRCRAWPPQKLKFDKLPEWIFATVPEKMLKKGTPLNFTYQDNLGRVKTITDNSSWMAWLETHWMVHPPELRVMDTTKLLATNREREEEIHAIFARYDTDKSGGLSVSEVRPCASLGTA
jgi:hypothetical protein